MIDDHQFFQAKHPAMVRQECRAVLQKRDNVDLNLGDSPTDKGLSPTVVPERSGWYSSVPDIISTFGCW